MICAFLLYAGMTKDASDALDFYGHQRTKDAKVSHGYDTIGLVSAAAC